MEMEAVNDEIIVRPGCPCPLNCHRLKTLSSRRIFSVHRAITSSSSAVKAHREKCHPRCQTQCCVVGDHFSWWSDFAKGVASACLPRNWAAMYLRRLVAAFPYSTRLFSSHNSPDIAATIMELNREMESVFGEAPPSGISGSSQDPAPISEKMGERITALSHINSSGKAQMVDISPKERTERSATATCKVILGKKVFDLVYANQMGKGDVLGVAKIAGISGAKHTSTLIPLCHNITLSHVRVELSLNPGDYSVDIEGEAGSTEKTGVEMEAMTAVTIAGLTVYDMCKAASKDIQITNVRLERKSGGKSGEWMREENC